MKPTIEQKALAAARAYAFWQKEIKRLSGRIGDSLNRCHINKGDSNRDTHLAEAYRPDVTEYRTEYMSEDDVVRYLAENCRHCLAAHDCIQERKAARKKFGAAKRQITRLGKLVP